jgi:hypothetical protein
MQLTLRTLLAWLDDKLPPSEVREIGKQVAEVDYAKKLVDRIHKVTRQRRLSVPPSTGPEAIDPNVVAGYIDNELDPDQVGEFEKKCLTSDVHLAEVSSIHQILSLIGQRAKVPIAARNRMYQLVKGREALRPKHHEGGQEELDTNPLAQPIQPWVTAPPPHRPALQRYGPVALVVVLMASLAGSAWWTLSIPESRPTARNLAIAAPRTKPREKAGKNQAKEPAPASTIPVVAGPGPAASDAAAVPPAAKAAAKDKDAAKAETPPSDIPAGAVALARKPDGILLRFNANPDQRAWVRITEPTPLPEQDRLLGLEPYRSSVEIGSASIDLVGETEVWLRSTPRTLAARLTLSRGRLALHGNPSGLPFEVQLGDTTVTITPPPGVTVGVEKVSPRASGEAAASASLLTVYVTDGPVKVASGRETATIEAAGSISIGPGGAVTNKTSKPAPSWVAETSPPPFDQKIGEQFLQFFRPGRETLASLVEASESEQKDVCRLAISALGAVGDVSLVVPFLHHKGGATALTARRAAIVVLRAYLAGGTEASKTLLEALKRDLGDEMAPTVAKLLVGYTAKEAQDEATYDGLVKLLGSTDDASLGARELALENLCHLTGRDTLEYDPEKPEGVGLKAWRDLLRDHELKPAPERPKGR